MLEQVAMPDPPEVAWLLPSYSGELAFDVGANVGQSMKTMAKHFDRVISFEPHPESYEVLARTLPPNGVAMQVALTSSPGPVTMQVRADHDRRGQYCTDGVEQPNDEHAWGPLVREVTVQGDTLDRVAKRFGVPSMIKCDVEGHEVEVFRGASEVLLRKPDLLIEVHSARLGEELMDMLTPIYGESLGKVPHPHYGPGSWGKENHWWLISRQV